MFLTDLDTLSFARTVRGDTFYYYYYNHHHHYLLYAAYLHTYVYSREKTMSLGSTCCSCSIVAVYGASLSLVPALALLYFYVSSFRSTCAVHNMTVFCSSLMSWCPGMLPTYFLNDFEMVPGAPIITGITLVFALLLLLLFLASKILKLAC
jgi:hypothetical protein